MIKKIYNNRVYTNFQDNKIPKDNEYFVCNSDKEYHPQILLEECKYAIKNKKKQIQLVKT